MMTDQKNNIFEYFNPEDIQNQSIHSPDEIDWVDEMPDYDNPWMFQDKPLTDANIIQFVGMVYIIVNNVNNKKYVGKKIFQFVRRIKQKNKKNRKVKKTESDWKIYYGSSDLLNEDIKIYGNQNFSRYVLALCKNKKAMTYEETLEQFTRHVLETSEYYNVNILGKFFVKDKLKQINFSENILCLSGDVNEGKRCRDEKIGFHALTAEQRREINRKIIKESIEGTVWITDGEENKRIKKAQNFPLISN